MINININNMDYEIPENLTVLQACNQFGIHVPTLCHDERLEAEASCNLCIVEVNGQSDLKTSCSLRVEEGMIIKTNSQKVISARREVLDKLIWGHPDDCTDCHKTRDCKLHSYCDEYEVVNKTASYTSDREIYPKDTTNLFYDIDPNKCISCNLCINVCNELQGRSSLEINHKGYISRKTSSSENNQCEDCGNCVSVCPTGALMPKQYMMEVGELHDTETMKQNKEETEESRYVKTTCAYCGVGCQLELVVKDEHVVDCKPVNVLPNTGLLCVKGKFGFKFINHPDRLKTPLIRKNGEFVEASWEEAYNLITEKANEIKSKYGSDVFGGLSSARCTNEENYLFQKLVRVGFGTNNIDHCARL